MLVVARLVVRVVSAVARVAASSETCFWMEPAVVASARRFDTVPVAPPVATVAVLVRTAVVPEVFATFARLATSAVKLVPVPEFVKKVSGAIPAVILTPLLSNPFIPWLPFAIREM